MAGYFLPPSRIRRALHRCAARGGQVLLLLAGKSDVPVARYAAEHLYTTMMEGGAELYEYQPQVLHAKLILMDDIVYVGSCNLDRRSLDINFELLLRLEWPELAAQGASAVRRRTGLEPPGPGRAVARTPALVGALAIDRGVLAAHADRPAAGPPAAAFPGLGAQPELARRPQGAALGLACLDQCRYREARDYKEGVRMKSIRTVWCVALAALLSGCGYNQIQTQDEAVKAAWSEVVNQYQRRADLVPNLVNTVKGYAAQEKSVLLGVTEARAKVGTIQATPELINDEAAFKKFQAAQGELTQALKSLIAVTENYPQLKSDQNFRDLQAQLEGTENRITVARNRYIDAVRGYNVTIRSFPSNLTAMIFKYQTKPNFAVENEAAIAKPPTVDFGTSPAPASAPPAQ